MTARIAWCCCDRSHAETPGNPHEANAPRECGERAFAGCSLRKRRVLHSTTYTTVNIIRTTSSVCRWVSVFMKIRFR